MCKTCLEGEVEWSPRNALRATRYHTKLFFRILERLDLPLAHLQELRLAATRPSRRRAPVLARSEGQWRSSPSGALYLCLEAKCPVWLDVLSAVASCQDASSDVEPPQSAFTSACLGSSEADLVSEAEIHLCAALRHLSAVRTAIEATIALGQSHNLDVACDTEAAKASSSECLDAKLLQTQFDACLEELLAVAWPFFLRMQLASALLQGDILRAAAWAVQFLGVAEPWGLRRVQELTSLGLELAAEHLGTRSGRVGHAAGGELPAWGLLREACTAYLGVPIIPRFESRLRRTVSRLSELGLRSSSGTNGDDSSLARTLDAVLKPESVDGPREFDSSGGCLGTFRAADRLHRAFRKAFERSVAGHLDGNCKLQTREAVLAGIEAVTSLGVGGAMPEIRRRQLQEAVCSVLEEPPVTKAAHTPNSPSSSSKAVVRALPEPPASILLQLPDVANMDASSLQPEAFNVELPSSQNLKTQSLVDESHTEDSRDESSGKHASVVPELAVTGAEGEEKIEDRVPPGKPLQLSIQAPPKESLQSPRPTRTTKFGTEQEITGTPDPKTPKQLRPCPAILSALPLPPKLLECKEGAARTDVTLDIPVVVQQAHVNSPRDELAKTACGSDDSEETSTIAPSSSSTPSSVAASEGGAEESAVEAEIDETDIVSEAIEEGKLTFAPPPRARLAQIPS